MAVYWRAGIVGYFKTGTWVGEMAYMGISGVGVDGGGDFQPVLNQPLPTFDAKPDGTYTSDATYDMYGGSVGVGAWSYAHQRALADAMVSFAQSVKGFQQNTFEWREVRVAAFQPNNKVVNGATVFVLKTPFLGGSTTSLDGPDRAVAVSWRTAGRGTRNRGRIYIPAPAAAGDSAFGGPSSATRNTAGNAGRTLHDAANAVQNLYHVVVSPTHQTYSTIATVEVGDEWDTQSRRRRSRPEQYTAY